MKHHRFKNEQPRTEIYQLLIFFRAQRVRQTRKQNGRQ